MGFKNEGMIKLLVRRTQPGGDEYHKANALPTYSYSIPTTSQHTGQCLIMKTRSRGLDSLQSHLLRWGYQSHSIQFSETSRFTVLLSWAGRRTVNHGTKMSGAARGPADRIECSHVAVCRDSGVSAKPHHASLQLFGGRYWWFQPHDALVLG